VTARVSVEQAGTLGWSRYVGPNGICLGMNTFGASAPLQQLQQKFGFTAERVAAAARQVLGSDPSKVVPPTDTLPTGE
jgi:transketolase